MLLLKANTIKKHNTPASIAALSSEVGGCPRDIVRLLRDRASYTFDLQQATCCLDVICLLTTPFPADGYLSDSFDFALVQKQDIDRKPEDMKDDRYIFTSPSPVILRLE